MRRRRRGRTRYSPYPPGGVSSDLPASVGGPSGGSSSVSALGARSSGGQFVCPHCKSLFGNRDALAMHMLDSVRSDGACGGTASTGGVSAAAAAAVAAAAVVGATTAHNGGPAASSSLPSVSTSSCGATAVSASSANSATAVAGGCLTCRVCSESLPSLDTMAMHMLAHAHQEQLRLESHRMEGLQSVMKRVASHYSDLLRGFAPPGSAPIPRGQALSVTTSPQPPAGPQPPPLASSFPTNKETRALSLSPAASSPTEAKLNFEEDEGGSSGQPEVIVKVEEEPASTEMLDESSGLEEAVAVLEGAFPFVCRHCLIAFADRTMFCLHMGLHNVNNPWQCNMCGKACTGRHEFASHVLHF